MFAPGEQITRQEMFTLLYNALKVIGRLPEGTEGKELSPEATTTRAEMAQVLYSLLSK